MKTPIQIDFFELQILVERCFNSSTILSMSVLEKAIDTWFFCLEKDEIKRIFETIAKFFKVVKVTTAEGLVYYAKLSPGKEKIEDFDNDFQKKFIARFNPDNQYMVTASDGKKTETVQCFMFDNQYHVSTNTTFQEKFITKIEKLCH